MAEIYAIQRKINAMIADAEIKDKRGIELMRKGNPELKEAGEALRREAESIRNSKINRKEGQLERLKQALSAFKTEVLPGFGDDKGVVL